MKPPEDRPAPKPEPEPSKVPVLEEDRVFMIETINDLLDVVEVKLADASDPINKRAYSGLVKRARRSLAALTGSKLDRELTKDEVAGFLQTKGSMCPYSDCMCTTFDCGELESDIDYVWREVQCVGCDREFKELYRLVDVEAIIRDDVIEGLAEVSLNTD
jgi:hypothetical protein